MDRRVKIGDFNFSYDVKAYRDYCSCSRLYRAHGAKLSKPLPRAFRFPFPASRPNQTLSALSWRKIPILIMGLGRKSMISVDAGAQKGTRQARGY